MVSCLTLAGLTAVCAAVGANVGGAGEEPVLLRLTGARVLDVDRGQLHDGLEVWLRGERIEGLVAAGESRPEGPSRTLDLSGWTLLPGLIDLHSHLLLHPYDEASWNDQVLRESLELRTIRATVAARKTLQAGFTTLRELGTEGAAYADVALRDAIAAGLIPGPRILAATRAIVATGCYGPSGFDPRWTLPKGAEVADGVAGIRRTVRSQIAAGADWVKVYADYRRRPGGASTPTFSQEELEALVDEAHTAKIPVAAHAVTDEAIRRAVVAGVQTIEHGYEASEEVLQLMRERGVVLCPTLSASEAIARYRGWREGAEPSPRILASKRLMERALRVGVTIACGSDVGVFSHGDNARELELMALYGMPRREVLRSATTVAAKVLGREQDLGQVGAGFLADLIAVPGNPLEDLSCLRRPRLVIQGGKIVAHLP
jgi:imidazolonepropionase-like amidohydrolase